MRAERLNAFTDGVLAIVITIMVLELPTPKGHDLADLLPEMPLFAAYALSFINIGIFWNNHHHLMTLAKRIDGRVMWANLALLFWLSLVPFVIRWMGEEGLGSGPVASYGAVLVASAAKSACDAVRIACGAEVNPADVLAAMNAAVFQQARRRRVMTCFASVVDAKAGVVTHANAGHQFAYRVRTGGEAIRFQRLTSRGRLDERGDAKRTGNKK